MNSPNDPSARRTSRRDIMRLGGASAALSLLPFRGVRAQAGRVKKFRYAHSAPTTHAWHLWGERFKSVVEEKTAGKIQVTIFPNAQMGNERDIAQQIRLGSLEMGSVGVALMNWVPQASITDAPFLFRGRSASGRLTSR